MLRVAKVVEGTINALVRAVDLMGRAQVGVVDGELGEAVIRVGIGDGGHRWWWWVHAAGGVS